MKKSLLWIAALALSSQAALLAQNLTGIWQGTLQTPNRGLRTVIEISSTDKDTLKAVLYSIDQSAEGLPSSSVTVQGSTVKISIPGIGGTYEGRLSADENSITGTWAQGPRPATLNLTRVTEETAWAIPKGPAPLKPTAADANPVFEVATIKPSKPGRPGSAFRVQGRQFSTINTTMSALISYAYGLQESQILGGPSWVESDKYDIMAKPDGEGEPSNDQWKAMLQKLLADRFLLTLHSDKKELSV